MNCDCFFCGENKFSLNKIAGLPCGESIVYENENVFVTPDIAPLVVGHLLIVAKKHITCFAGVDDFIQESLVSAKEYLKNVIFKETNYIFFEHGAVISDTAGSCIDHAHIHAVPIKYDVNLDGYIEKCGFVHSKKEVFDKTKKQFYVTNKQPYIYYEKKNCKECSYPVDILPHQFFRIMIASFYSVAYNWKLQYKSSESKTLFYKTLEYIKEQNVQFYTKKEM